MWLTLPSFIANRTSYNLHRDALAWILCWSFVWTNRLPDKERGTESQTSEEPSRIGCLEGQPTAVHFSAASFELGCTFLFAAIVSRWVTTSFKCLSRLLRHFYFALSRIIVNAGQCILSLCFAWTNSAFDSCPCANCGFYMASISNDLEIGSENELNYKILNAYFTHKHRWLIY